MYMYLQKTNHQKKLEYPEKNDFLNFLQTIKSKKTLILVSHRIKNMKICNIYLSTNLKVPKIPYLDFKHYNLENYFKWIIYK